MVTATPAFYASDGRVVDNALDTPISATFTSLQTRTLQISTMIGTSGQLVNKLQTTVSATIVATRSTAIGVSGMVTVPPHSRVVGTYGVEGFDIAYTGQTVWRWAASPTVCWDRGTRQGAVSAPTYLEGWKFTAG